jgi:ArsR family transcriptional regulator
MQNIEAARALSALGHETRLTIFRTLVQAGPEGLAAGDIARMLDLAPNALSFHLKDLTHAGLTESRQSGRFVIYSAVYPVMTGLVDYLTENCCGGVDCSTAATLAGGRRQRLDGRTVATPPSRRSPGGTSRTIRNGSRK